MILHFIRQPGIEIVVRSADPRRQCLYGLIRLLDAPVGAVPNLSHKRTFKSHWLIHRIIGHQMQRSLGQMRPDFIQYILIPASGFAEHGDRDGQCNLAWFYENGIGIISIKMGKLS